MNVTGSGSFNFAVRRNGATEYLPVWYYRPARFSETGRILFVMHGVKRNAVEYRDTWTSAAERYGFLLLCPEFSALNYPRKAYHLGGLVDDSGGWLPEEEWTFHTIERLFDFVKEKTGTVKDSYLIYGHSAGGQFVHRLALFMPRARFETAVAANTGWYTMPTFDGKKFPYGLKRSGATRSGLKKALGRRLVVMLGEWDTDAGDPTLRKSKAARRQGETRLERGLAFYSTAQDEASELGVPLNWELATVPGVAHYDPHMMPAAARVLFGCEYAGTRALLETTALSANCCRFCFFPEEVLNNVDKRRMEFAAAVLIETIEVRDPNLAAHLKAVSRISRLVGSGMSLARDQLDVLAVGALLHDVGKLGLPDSLLRKPTRLDAAEDETMRHHPLLGARMLGLVAELASAIPAVKHHHERFDGEGYPDGLRGDEIPLMARIVSVSDALDSMVRGRPYRPGRSVGEALREIASCSGTQFDPGVVNVLLEHFSKQPHSGVFEP